MQPPAGCAVVQTGAAPIAAAAAGQPGSPSIAANSPASVPAPPIVWDAAEAVSSEQQQGVQKSVECSDANKDAHVLPAEAAAVDDAVSKDEQLEQPS
jgi:hypothetical protein